MNFVKIFRKAMEVKQLVALDFAGTGIRAVAAEVLDGKSIRVLSDEHRKVDGIKNGIIGQPSGTAFNVAALLKELQNSAGLHEPVRYVSAAVGGKGMRIVPFTITRSYRKRQPITATMIDEMAHACEEEFQQEGLAVYDVIPTRYTVDGRVMEQPEGQKGSEIVGEYKLVVGNEQLKTQLQKCMERIYNADVNFMPLAAEAFSKAVSSEEEREDGCAVISFGDSSTTLAIYKDDILQQLIVVPLGGKHITRDIAETGISEESAEKLKCLKGVCMKQLVDKPVNIKIAHRNPDEAPIVLTNQFLALIIEARLDEIMEPLFEELKLRRRDLPHGIILTGGGSRLGKLKEYIEERTGIYTRQGDHSGWLSDDTDSGYASPEFAQLIGTLILADSFNSDQAEQAQLADEGSRAKKKSGKRRSFGDSITQGIFRFFDDDTSLQEPEETV